MVLRVLLGGTSIDRLARVVVHEYGACLGVGKVDDGSGCWFDTLLGPQGPSIMPVVGVGFGCWVPLLSGCLHGCVGGWVVRGCFLRTSQWTRASLCQVFKGTWWMPWHQKPMKDARICDKPRGVDN